MCIRDSYVTVVLMRNGKEYQTVELNAENGWECSWRNLNDRYDWSVKEINVPDGFTVTTEQNGTVVTITNDDVPTPPVDSGKPTTPTVPDEPTNPTDSPNPDKANKSSNPAPVSYTHLDVHFLASKEEVERIHQKMDELGVRSMGAYLRKMALDGYCINLDLQDVKEMVSLLRRCSNNLNQYAKRANETGSIYQADINLSLIHIFGRKNCCSSSRENTPARTLWRKLKI